MVADTSIYSLIKPPATIEGPMDSYAKMATLGHLMDQGKISALQFREAERGVAEDDSIRRLLRENPSATESQILGISLNKGLPLIKNRQEARKNLAETNRIEGQNLDAELARHKSGLTSVNDPASAANWIMSGFNNPILSPLLQRAGSPQEIIARIPQDPAQFQQWKMQNGLGLDKVMELTKEDYKQIGGQVRNMNPLSPGANVASITAPITPTVGESETIRRNAVREPIEAGNLSVAQGNLGVNQAQLANSVNPVLQGALAAAKGEGTETGKANAELGIEPVRTAVGARKILDAIQYDPVKRTDNIQNLIRTSTSGPIQNIGALGYGAVIGSATKGMENIAKLQTEINRLTMDLMPGGKLGAGISNTDREFILGQMGDIANPNTPNNARLAAWKQVTGRINAIAAKDTPARIPVATPTPIGGRNISPKQLSDAELIREFNKANANK